ncbi:MAG: 5-formyltetrahydrofolate cyclo-ligase [bacterium]|nr:5-formyltetrahydrofolate cyclo-ligase [bacterium]
MIDQKKALRKIMLEKRFGLNQLAKYSYDQWVCDALEKIILAQKLKVVHAYIPMSGEIFTLPLLRKLLELNIRVVCPKTLPKRKLENRILSNLTHLETGIMGTQHPANSAIYEGQFDLIIVPGLAFDKQGFRLGYGGGYYDGFLANQPNALKIGIFYPFQEVDNVPLEDHDLRLDKILVRPQ